MTNALASSYGRSRASALEAGVDTVLSRLRTAWRQYVAYRYTLAELQALPARTLSDLDLNRGELRSIAHRDVHGQ